MANNTGVLNLNLLYASVAKFMTSVIAKGSLITEDSNFIFTESGLNGMGTENG